MWMPSPCEGKHSSALNGIVSPPFQRVTVACDAMETDDRHLKDISDGFARSVRRFCDRWSGRSMSSGTTPSI